VPTESLAVPAATAAIASTTFCNSDHVTAIATMELVVFYGVKADRAAPARK